VAINTIDDHLAVLGQLRRPGGHLARIAPARAGDHGVGLLEHARAAHVEHEGARRVALRGGDGLAGCVHAPLVAQVDPGPVDVGHEGIDVSTGGRAEVHVVRVLVHVQRQNGHATGQRMRVVGRPLVDERALARLEDQQHPARAAGQRLAHADELFTPAFDAAEVGLQRQPHRRLHGLPVATQAGEIQLVQQHRVGGDQFLALEAVELESRCACE
jgi:hypothetical protein